MYGKMNQNIIMTTMQNSEKRTEFLTGVAWVIVCIIGVISYVIPVRALCKIAKKL